MAPSRNNSAATARATSRGARAPDSPRMRSSLSPSVLGARRCKAASVASASAFSLSQCAPENPTSPAEVVTRFIEAARKEPVRLPGRQITVCREYRKIEPVGGAIEQRREHRLVVAAFHASEISQPFGLRAAAYRRENVNDLSAANGALRGLVPEDQTIAPQRANRPVEYELNQRRRARRNAGAFEHSNSPRDVGRAQVDVYRRPMSQRLLLTLENPQPGVNLGYRIRHITGHDPIAPADQIILQSCAGEIESTPLARSTGFRWCVLRMNRPDSRRYPSLQHANLIADGNRPRDGSSGDDQARSRDAEAPVDG